MPLYARTHESMYTLTRTHAHATTHTNTHTHAPNSSTRAPRDGRLPLLSRSHSGLIISSSSCCLCVDYNRRSSFIHVRFWDGTKYYERRPAVNVPFQLRTHKTWNRPQFELSLYHIPKPLCHIVCPFSFFLSVFPSFSFC